MYNLCPSYCRASLDPRVPRERRAIRDPKATRYEHETLNPEMVKLNVMNFLNIKGQQIGKTASEI